eukprot:TRINITY_DN7748_c0_g2_i1.p1 TRINITY_DN7748_c0_g2~~TRINITY_DN7748_c0_g2_i1.p1  ORF type:complete len:105 (-),score=18.29 TRINITY_DN7748_c0_g2_i1:203-517(-)
MAVPQLRVWFILLLVCTVEQSFTSALPARPSRRLRIQRRPPSSPSPTHTGLIGERSKKVALLVSDMQQGLGKTAEATKRDATGKLERTESIEKFRHQGRFKVLN